MIYAEKLGARYATKSLSANWAANRGIRQHQAVDHAAMQLG